MTSSLERIRRIELEGERLNWLAHAATFRVLRGKVEESTRGGITTDKGVRMNLCQALEEGEDPAEHVEALVCPDVLGVAQGVTSFLQAEALFHESPLFRTGSLNDCKRMHMPELRVCAFHLNYPCIRRWYYSRQERPDEDPYHGRGGSGRCHRM